MKQVRFEFEELPYDTLAQFGLTREMIEDLPSHTLEDLSHGRHSPVLPIRITNDGNVIEERSRFAFIRKESGEVDVVFYPVLKKSPIEKYDAGQRKRLVEGKVILADALTADGRSTKAFVQIDPGTGQVMSVPTQVIARNLKVLADELALTGANIRTMQQGEPVTFVMDDEPVSVGIDLNERTGIRLCEGDGLQWAERSKREWDKYTFGCFGCWVMDDDGNLDYVPEEEYTEEMWNEQKNSATRNVSAGIHK